MTTTAPIAQRWRHDATGHVITTVGVTHVAPADTWTAVLAAARDHVTDGGVIHLEGVAAPPPGTLLSPRHKERIKHARRIASLSQYVAAAAGLAYQRTHLHDPLMEGNRTPGDPLHRRVEVHDTDLAALTDTPFPPPWNTAEWPVRLVERVIADHPNPVALVAGPTKTTPVTRAMFAAAMWAVAGVSVKVLIHDRNHLAVEAAATASRDVMLIWGAGHIPGMDLLLVSPYGYRVMGAAVNIEGAVA